MSLLHPQPLTTAPVGPQLQALEHVPLDLQVVIMIPGMIGVPNPPMSRYTLHSLHDYNIKGPSTAHYTLPRASIKCASSNSQGLHAIRPGCLNLYLLEVFPPFLPNCPSVRVKRVQNTCCVSHKSFRPLTLGMQASASSTSLSSAGGQSASGGTDYLKSALDASAAQKETFFARKMEVSASPAEQKRDSVLLQIVLGASDPRGSPMHTAYRYWHEVA